MTPFAPDLLECLAAIVEEGGFERAAKRLSITQSAVSQRLHTLETQAGTVLIVRGRPLRPTPAGRIMLRHAMQMRLLHTGLEHDLRQFIPGAGDNTRTPERIAIAVNADSIATWALPAFDALASGGLPLEIIADDQDFTQDWLREGQVLGCVTTLAKAMRGCRIAPLGAMNYTAVITPETLNKFCPTGISPQTARQIPFIAFNRKMTSRVNSSAGFFISNKSISDSVSSPVPRARYVRCKPAGEPAWYPNYWCARSLNPAS